MATPGSKQPVGRVLAALDEVDLRALSRSLSDDLRERKVTFGSDDGGNVEAFVVDPVPRVIEREEWAALAAGLAQRAEALECFVADIYGERRIVAAGRVPWSAIESAEFFEPRMAQLPPAAGRWIPIAGLDVVRDGDGPFVVLEDNVRTPSGIAYAVAAREALSGHVSVPDGHARALVGAGLQVARRGAARGGAARGRRAAVDRRAHRRAVELGLLRARRDRPPTRAAARACRGSQRALQAALRTHRGGNGGGRRRLPPHERGSPVRCRRCAHRLAEVLLGPLEAQTLACVNAFGTGVADDKLVHSYVEEMVRFYLAEEPLLESVPTYDLSQPGVLAMVLERIGELVVKPRSGHGGIGVVVGPRSDRADACGGLARTAETRRSGSSCRRRSSSRASRPCAAASSSLATSTCARSPSPWATAWRCFPGGSPASRSSADRSSSIPPSSGGAKDTWVLA